jgi:hypothetical protein
LEKYLMSKDILAVLEAKDQIRDLVHLYSRGVDRKDIALLRTLYASDATDDHGAHFSGSANDYLDFLARSLPYIHVSDHYVCNHLIDVQSAVEASGEVYAIAWHIIPDGQGGTIEDIAGVRYIDRYRKEDGRWLFASRIVEFDHRSRRPVEKPERDAPSEGDPSHALAGRIFARGARE